MTDAELGNVLPLLEEWMPQERVRAVPRVCVGTPAHSLTHTCGSQDRLRLWIRLMALRVIATIKEHKKRS